MQHLLTPITGELIQGEHILNLVERLHPTSAVAGTPTEKAMEIINKMERYMCSLCSVITYIVSEGKVKRSN